MNGRFIFTAHKHTAAVRHATQKAASNPDYMDKHGLWVDTVKTAHELSFGVFSFPLDGYLSTLLINPSFYEELHDLQAEELLHHLR